MIDTYRPCAKCGHSITRHEPMQRDRLGWWGKCRQCGDCDGYVHPGRRLVGRHHIREIDWAEFWQRHEDGEQ